MRFSFVLCMRLFSATMDWRDFLCSIISFWLLKIFMRLVFCCYTGKNHTFPFQAKGICGFYMQAGRDLSLYVFSFVVIVISQNLSWSLKISKFYISIYGFYIFKGMARYQSQVPESARATPEVMGRQKLKRLDCFSEDTCWWPSRSLSNFLDEKKIKAWSAKSTVWLWVKNISTSDLSLGVSCWCFILSHISASSFKNETIRGKISALRLWCENKCPVRVGFSAGGRKP